jgi:hypothetical protein
MKAVVYQRPFTVAVKDSCTGRPSRAGSMDPTVRAARLPRQDRRLVREAPPLTGRLTGHLRLGRSWTGCVTRRPLMTGTCPRWKCRNLWAASQPDGRLHCWHAASMHKPRRAGSTERQSAAGVEES